MIAKKILSIINTSTKAASKYYLDTVEELEFV